MSKNFLFRKRFDGKNDEKISFLGKVLMAKNAKNIPF